MNIIALSDKYKEEVERIAVNSWGSIYVAAHRELFDLRTLPCFVAVSDEYEILGYCYYRNYNNEYEIMAVESIKPNSGAGSALVEAVVLKARNEDCKRVYLQTSNDNTRALRFYQRRGFMMCAVRLNEFEHLRMLKPEIPLIGAEGIPLMHVIELELIL
jgi:ribosomal protein S18 acetylase RimI-like enzyme